MTELKPVSDRVWRRFALTFLGVFGGGVGLLYLALLVIDPYDTGRFPTFMKTGVVDEGQRTSNASHGRDPRFTAAVIGNSRGQMLDPAKLSALTGMDFVQLTTPASGPVEQMTMLRYFMAYHRKIDAVILTRRRALVRPRPVAADHPAVSVLALSRQSRIPRAFLQHAGADLRRAAHQDGARPRPGGRCPRLSGLRDRALPQLPSGPASARRSLRRSRRSTRRSRDSIFSIRCWRSCRTTTHVVFLMSPVYQVFLDRELDPQIIADLPRCKTEVAAARRGAAEHELPRLLPRERDQPRRREFHGHPALPPQHRAPPRSAHRGGAQGGRQVGARNCR